ncbi:MULTISPECIES: hypothetical protein [Cryobacterium]|uniref:Calcium-binding protein n=1 Tax=Cryobacterium breve TaxID=1259258 RepID=A0ABY2J8R9_9MICO|nr:MULTISPECIES: hypothetical protein [Cryobacterium]TFC91318.1 hypothetical protein E3T20_13810 [Cryobacterium sp. TmT3-12]TFD01343.1 hypothetical protein E3O65_01465 [Cryobacterium breve]
MVVLIVTGVGYVAGQADSDDDGLSNRVEVFGWGTLGGSTFTTDPNAADTDGDGLTDGDEAGQVVSDPDESTLYAGISNPTKVDSDDDDLDDKHETSGWLSTRGAVYRTDPMDPDTDDDGLTDGDEAGPAVSDRDTGIEFTAFSSPLMPDTDGDGMSDAAEADLSLDAFDRDSDGDEIEDGREVEHFGTAPDVADTDGDGFDDGYEVENQESQGLDPLWADVKVEPSTYARDFAQGAVFGEIRPGDSLAWFAGNLASGSSSVIPGVGTVVGGVADLRDAVGSSIHADWVGAGFSVVGLVPVAGDAVAIPAKASKFVLRHPELAPAVGAAIVALKWVPDDIKVATLTQTTKSWPGLQASGFSEKSLLRLQKGRVGLDSLAEAMKRPGHVKAGGGARFFATPKKAEAYLARTHGVKDRGEYTQVGRSTKDCIEVCNAVVRRFDVVVDDVAHESKLGRVNLSPSIERQIRSDAYLVQKGDIKGAHWDFFASSVSNTMGPSAPVLDLLDEMGIPYTIHVPA